MRIAFAGGGTWWHVFPIRALIQHIYSHGEYKRKAEALVRFGEKWSLEEHVAKEFSDVKFVPIVSGKLRRSPSWKELAKNMYDLGSMTYGIIQCLRLLKKHKIDVIFCKGGYVSLPVVIAGRILRKKIILHESDTKAGLSNKICAKFANHIFTGFAGVFPHREVVVWQILSNDLLNNSKSNLEPETIDRNWAPRIENWESTKTSILVTWGSQGAESVYRPLAALIKKNGYKGSHFHIVLGTKNTGLKSLFEGLSNTTCYDFVSQKEMGGLLSLCDAAITRAGTTSLAEEKLFWLKLVIVPIPWTHDQLRNAEYYMKRHGDLLVKQDDSFLLNLPIALDVITKHKKNRTQDNIETDINNAKDVVCQQLFDSLS